MTPEERAELRRIAENATPGPWEFQHYLAYSLPPEHRWIDSVVAASEDFDYRAENGSAITVSSAPADAEYIAAFDPPTALRLLDAADQRDELQARLDAVLAAATAFYDDILPLYDLPAAVTAAARGEQA